MTEAPQDQDLQAWVSRSETVRDVASRSAAIGLGAVLDQPVDPDSAEGRSLFPVGHWLQFTPTAAMSELGSDGHPRLGGFMPPIPLPRRMWAGSRIDFHAPIAVGEKISRTTTIASVTPKSGSTGRLCFVELRHDVHAGERLALTELQTIVYREAVEPTESAARPPRADAPSPEGWDWVRERRPDEVALFRYSALTFNSHRIHYDRPYATEVEGYPGLVVHGPLSATYIVDAFLREHPGAELTSFEFSARAPLFAGELLHIVGRTEGTGSEELAVLGPNGKPAVTARIEFH